MPEVRRKRGRTWREKESADTLEYESCQLNDMEVDIDENKEESSCIPSALSSSVGWDEPQFTCDRQCPKQGFKYYDIASVIIEDDLRQGERKEPVVKSRLSELPVAERRSRGKLAAGLGTHGLLLKIMEIPREKLLKDAAKAICLGKEWLEVYPHKGESALWRESGDMRLPGVTVRKAVKAGLAHDWWELVRSEEVTPQIMAKLKKSNIQARQDDDQRRSIVQKVMLQSTDFLRRIIATVDGQGGATFSHERLHCHRFPLEDHI